MEHFEVWLDMDYIYVRNAQGNVASKPIARYERSKPFAAYQEAL